MMMSRQQDTLLWYQKPLSEILKEFSVGPLVGLTNEQVETKRLRYGPNVLPRGKSLRWWQLLLRQFVNPLVFILLIAAGLTIWI